MPRRTAPLVATILIAGAAGCSTLNEMLAPLKPARQAPVLVARDLKQPINRSFFILDAPDQALVGEPQVVFTDADNTLSDLAREYGLGYDELVAANPDVDPWLPGANTPVLLPTQYLLPDAPREGIVLNIASKRLFYFPPLAEGQPRQVITYPIGIGRVGWETPLGEANVIAKARDPHWYTRLSVRQEHAEMGDPLPSIVPPGPDNPLGRFVLKLDLPGYLIHGTNQPYGVGMRVSHGCVRLYPENIEALYPMIDLGVPVRIVNQPYLAGWHGGELFVESHAPLEDDEVAREDRVSELLESVGDAVGRATLDAVRAVLTDARGVPIRVSQHDNAEVLARARLVENTVEPDPDMPTLAEVRELLDTPLPEEETPESNE